MMHLATILFSTASLMVGAAQGYRIKVNFHDGNVKDFDVPSGNLTADELLANPRRAVVFGEESQYDKRQVCTTLTTNWYELVGDGDPHQNYKIAQVANTIVSCPANINQGYSHTTSWSFSAGRGVAVEGISFADLGFGVSVSDTRSTSRGFSCDGRPTDMCALSYTAVTALTVNFYKQISCGSWMGPVEDEGVGTVYLPNANGIGSTLSRGLNFGDRNIIQCRGDAERKIDFLCGPKGGPEWFDTHQPGPYSAAYLAERDPPDCVAPIETFHFEFPDEE